MTMLCPNPPIPSRFGLDHGKWTVAKFGPDHWDAIPPLGHPTNGACFDNFEEALAHAMEGK